MPSAEKSEYTIREARPADLDIIIRHRRNMFAEMGYRQDARFTSALEASRRHFGEQLERGTYRGWFIENTAGQIVAGGGLFILEYPPSPRDPSPRRPLIVNMYTEPACRRRGLARRLMETMIAWCREQGFGSIMLHASAEGRPLYASLGFQPANEMRLMVR